ncbi:MAG: hypothetical protein PHI68_07690, partial [Candidatus Cloacimonetes bacterium]|nr:hypothetical protein [Candidatus Cloacimonadota bacterium]
MKGKALITLLLLLVFTAILAIEDYSVAEEHKRKTQELNQLADRFRAETGFEGSISYNYQYMRISQIRGIFCGIQMKDNWDTGLAEYELNQVLQRISPFTLSREGQLIPMEMEITQTGLSQMWVQKVNGYSIHPGGYIQMTYHSPTDKFMITDATVDISNEPVPINISKEEAKQIIINEYKKSAYYNGRVRGSSQEPSIAYNRISTSKDPLQYRLYWSMMFHQVSFSIDVKTLEIHQHMNIMMYNIFAVRGITYKPTISGLVFDPTTPPESSLRGINVVNGDQNGFTDPNGCIQLSLSPQENYKVSLRGERWDIRSIYNESTSLNVDYYTEIGPMSYETNILDVIDTQDELIPAPPSLYAANIYYHLQNQDDIFTELSPSFSSVTYPVIYNDNEALPANDWGGVFEVNYNTGTVAIHYYNGYNPYIIMHELSHFFTYNRMRSATFSILQRNDAMDEAFAEYWVGRGLFTNSFIRNYSGNPIAIDLLDVYDIHSSQTYNNQGLPLNEDFYSWYYCGMPITTVWDNIRSLHINSFDSELLSALLHVENNLQYIYKPRYFYNILMNQVDDDFNPYPLNPKQDAIMKAYTSRGFHFYPKVESQSAAQKSRSSFSPGDQVYVNITQAPQNTPFKVYVIRHGDYTYINGAQVSTLTNHLAGGFTPVEERTNSDGNWAGAVWTISTTAENVVGDYDIIVDFGDHIAPDNLIHFAFTNADVMDGFDGLTQPGFTVLAPPAIDIVLALDCSPSLTNRTQLARTARQFVAQLMDYDRVGVFGFASWVDNQQVMHDFTLKMIPSGSYGLTPIINNKENL